METSWAQGVLYFYGPEITELLLPNLTKLKKEQAPQIIKAFSLLLKRPIKPIFEEVKMKDRAEIRQAGFRGFGFRPKGIS